MNEGTSHADYNRVLQQAIARKQKIRELEASLAEQREQNVKLTKERDQYVETVMALDEKVKGFEAAPSDVKAELDRLRGEIKSRDHRAAWEKAARDYKGPQGEAIRPDALEALYKLAGGVPEGDAMPDAKALTESIAAAVSAHAFVLQAPQGAAPAGAGSGPGPGNAGDLFPTLPGPVPTRGGASGAPFVPDPKQDGMTRFREVTGHTNPFRIA